MRKVGRGGVSLFQPAVRPNQFNQIGVDDVITRHGESAMWFRMQPCPCPIEERIAECTLCHAGSLRSFQETFLQEGEQVKCDGHSVFPRYQPVRKVEKLVHRSEGENVPLNIKRVFPDRIEVEENLKDWAACYMDYEVDMIEPRYFEIAVNNERTVYPQFEGGVQGAEAAVKTYGAIVGVKELFFKGVDDESFEPIEALGANLESITLKERKVGTLRGVVNVFDPIHVAYHTMDADMKDAGERARIKLETGEMNIIVSQGCHMGPGDIVTFLITELRASHFVDKQEGMIDRIMFSPVTRIERVVSKQKEPVGKGHRLVEHHIDEDFVLIGSDRIMWLKDKPANGYSIMYFYHPSYEVMHPTETGGLQDRRLPRQFRVKKWSSFNGRT